ncbi:flavin reductase family protein [Oceanobacillus senegalensis]|uniref:flavin reductase family protein n=1 Tax=Oceanobacillus senegalensis TaxID=1936063 RepID=UPI000A30D018|nr:flavin reductase family protein [Oceanobacillus senegalensis]
MDDRLFRDAMGKFATGVTVIATEINGYVHGMTANAFMSVSLDPKLVLISVKEDSKTLEKIQTTESFTVNILAEHQVEVSKVFASKDKDTSNLTFQYLDGKPVIPEALAQVSCEVKSEYVEGDHTLFVGRVTDIRVQDGEPLIFSSGRYRNLEGENVNSESR